jgi:hypothetical protein
MTDTTMPSTDEAAASEVATKPKRHHAGAFDIRSIIAALIGVYGVVLTLTGLIGTSARDLARAGGMNINLQAGIGMVVVAALFLVWARLRPVAVTEPAEQDDDD